jgi:hypothetical protein
MKKNMCESCAYSKISIVDGWSKYPTIHKCKIYTILCYRTYSIKTKFVTLEDSKNCGYRPKAGQIDKKHFQKTLT